MALRKTSVSVVKYFNYCWWLFPSLKNMSIFKEKKKFLFLVVWNLPLSPIWILCVSVGKCFLISFPISSARQASVSGFLQTQLQIFCIFSTYKVFLFFLGSYDSMSNLSRAERIWNCLFSSLSKRRFQPCNVMQTLAKFVCSQVLQNTASQFLESVHVLVSWGYCNKAP